MPVLKWHTWSSCSDNSDDDDDDDEEKQPVRDAAPNEHLPRSVQIFKPILNELKTTFRGTMGQLSSVGTNVPRRGRRNKSLRLAAPNAEMSHTRKEMSSLERGTNGVFYLIWKVWTHESGTGSWIFPHRNRIAKEWGTSVCQWGHCRLRVKMCC